MSTLPSGKRKLVLCRWFSCSFQTGCSFKNEWVYVYYSKVLSSKGEEIGFVFTFYLLWKLSWTNNWETQSKPKAIPQIPYVCTCLYTYMCVHDIVLTFRKNDLLFFILSRIYKTSMQYFQASKQYFKVSILLQTRQQFIRDQVHKSTGGLTETPCTVLQSCAGVNVDIQTLRASPLNQLHSLCAISH